MSHWRVAQHYGFGAARVPIQPEPHRCTPSGLREGLTDLCTEFVEGGAAAMVRRTLGQSPAIALILMLLAAFVVTLVRDRSDVSPIEVVLFEDPPAAPDVLPEPIEELLPEPIPVAVEPPPPPPVEVEVEVEPEPPPQLLAERPKPPPPPPAAKPRPPKPPAMPQIARVEPPPPALRPLRPQRVEPRAAAKPRIQVDAVAPRPEPRVAAVPRTPQRSPRDVAPPTPVRMDVPRLEAAPIPDLTAPAPPTREFRVAAAANAPRVRIPRVTPGLAPTPQSPAAPATSAPARVRPTAPRPEATQRPLNVAPALAAAPAPLATAPRRAPTRVANRPLPNTPTRRAPRPAAALARAPAQLPTPLDASPATRVARAAQPLGPEGTSEARPGLAGVPLAELSACVSDRDEDRLKQAVVAAVTTQKECVSRAGTYRFVETKNLNSFLMWIDRASGRAVGDRCDELRYALQCLEGAGQRAAR